jgi:peptidoglycan/LPS O-acetylase OafA/YrhL
MKTRLLLPPAYRPDIDGLRAISAAAVICYHAGVPGFHGGYIGVDVFFVISGYIITQSLCGTVTDDRPSPEPWRHRLAQFYLRRARRLLPALIVVLLAVTSVASLLLRPADLSRYGKYLASTSVLLSNVTAWSDQDSTSGAPWTALIHLWTLSVEEQFYLAYPLLLLMGRRFLPRHPSALIGWVAGASFALCVWASYHTPLANFYLTPPRAWELLLGALLALKAPRFDHSFTRELLAVLGLGVIVAVICTYSPQTRYPGWYAAPPCIAAATLIAVGREHRTVVGRALSLRPLVFSGLISYSLYLWHAPVLALFGYWNAARRSALQNLALIGLIYLLAVATWLSVERPIRSRAWLGSDRRFVICAVLANLAIGCVGLLLWKS